MKKIVLILCMLVFSMTPIVANTKEEVTLNRCVDGDTAHFFVDGEDVTVRFLAINAPEYTKKKEPYGKEASAFVCNALTNAKKIELEYDDGSDQRDKYGRTLAWVYVDGKLLQKELVKQGLAEVKFIYGDYAYTDELKKLEKQAKSKQLNMWSAAPVEEKEESTPYFISALAGIGCIVIGVFFTKGKRNQKRMIKKGMSYLDKDK